MGNNKHKNNKTQDNKKQQNQNQNANRERENREEFAEEVDFSHIQNEKISNSCGITPNIHFIKLNIGVFMTIKKMKIISG